MQEFLSKIISEISQSPVQTFLQIFEVKDIIFSNLSLLRKGKITSIAMLNMNESQKKKKKKREREKSVIYIKA